MDNATRIDFETDDLSSPMDQGQRVEAASPRPDKVRQITFGKEIEMSVKELIRGRRQRTEFFPAPLFADPAWDILLVLTLADCQQRRMTVTNLCDSVDAPMTTALRWIHSMTEDGHLFRRHDMNDRRRKFIELSPLAREKMIEYCSREINPRALAA